MQIRDASVPGQEDIVAKVNLHIAIAKNDERRLIIAVRGSQLGVREVFSRYHEISKFATWLITSIEIF